MTSQKLTKKTCSTYEATMTWYRIEFRLEDFGHNNAHLTSKDYLTQSFFTPTQIDYALLGNEDLISHPKYEFEKSKSTPAVSNNLEIVRRLYTIRNVFISAHGFKNEKPRYPFHGRVMYITPGTIFRTYSQIRPNSEVIFIGKKRRVARILESQAMNARKVKKFVRTSPDLLSQEQFKKLSPKYFKIKLSQRWVFGEFEVEEALQIGDEYFISPIMD